ncbi:MAG: hypothetical protein H6548_08415 [Chitinophagales bacterium]|nr:hypothetical protein [Chitinophagales bacterium]HAE13346.1 hypothetical protein [Bacteroidota bacterium]MCB9019716.1 hypothetical protein [Chitinophagales bacterium]MCB9022127.1 hypothetical protein [Chitinophagales bacterium]MCB9031973.1 hypothetical protein [Chitinophagales bacterium]
MKRFFLVIAILGAGVIAAQAQSNTSVAPASDATPVVNAADHMGQGKSCCSAAGQEKQSCTAEKAASAAKDQKKGGSCCSAGGNAEAQSGKSCEGVSFGMGAAKPSKDE